MEFSKGINVKTVKTQYGEIIKLGINYEELGDNPINEKGYMNLVLKKGKSGNWYCTPDNYKSEN